MPAKKNSSSRVPSASGAYTEILQQLGLARNEARVYEALLRQGELSAGEIAVKSHVHRRNVYDSLQRLIERGLVFEIIQRAENRYRAVDPNKLRELIHEKEQSLLSVLPEMQSIYTGIPSERAVFIYRGIEGWKNYMRDILRVREDFYCIGGKGAWMDKRLTHFFPEFVKEADRLKIRYHHLFDYEVKDSKHDITKHVGKDYKILPEGYSAPASIDIFGDHVNIISNIHLGGVEDDMWFAVVVNRRIADAFRIWFRFMWDFCPAAA